MPQKHAIQIATIQPDGRVFIDMADGESNPCASCGACCRHYRISFYFGELDEHPGGFVPSQMADKLNETYACMRGTAAGGRCEALLGEASSGDIGCSIYSCRPSPCREFPVWMPDGEPNPDCQRLREKDGIEPLARKIP